MPGTENQYLASLAVFREIYDSQQDIYGVISKFLDYVIKTKGKYQFTLAEITRLLNDTFDFDIPDAVIRTSLNRLQYLSKKHGIYLVTEAASQSDDNLKINTLQKASIENNNKIIESLIAFTVQTAQVDLSKNERERIIQSFYSFLLDDADGGKYAEYVSGFVLKNQHNIEFQSQLKAIREGMILYSGLKYNDNISEIGSWKRPLTIFLDTEILFHAIGYNGELYKILFNDFFKYVKEINGKAQQKLIQLKYFREVKQEIEQFFMRARRIVDGRDILYPEKTAMASIVDGCTSPSDVKSKESDFFLFLQRSGILEDDTPDYYDDGNHKYNIISKDVVETISNEYRFDANEHLLFLNYVNIRRQSAESERDFYRIGYILLTGNTHTLKVAWHKLIKPNGTVPLAVDLYWLTNKFWFKLNKGFGDGVLPRSFDIITKAQIVLASILNRSVGEKYDELRSSIKSGAITEEQAKARIVALRSQARDPEDIIEDDVDRILNTLSGDSLERFIQEQEIQKQNAERYKEENIRLQKEKAALTQRLVTEKENLLREKQSKFIILKRQKENIDSGIDKSVKQLKVKVFFSVLAYYAVLFGFVWKYGWNKMEPLVWVLSSVPILASLGYMLVTERNVSYPELLKKKKQRIRDKAYQDAGFDNTLFEKSKLEIEKLEQEIVDLKDR